jgi:Zn-dependent protease with chaperone function
MNMTISEIKLSSKFKTQTTKAIFSIALFTFTYLFIFLLALGFTALCVFLGVMLIVTLPRFITIALGIGLASLGFLILIFLLKFVFKSHKVNRSHFIEISKTDEPELFCLIDEIVSAVGTRFPKKVYLSAEVNAAVFYNSNFWSMVIPVKKNLLIGLGLVNSVSLDEFKAIMAHEFGHFSQKTMKVGSYVYNVNQVIFNMLYDNESYEKLVKKWASISGYFSIFVSLAIKIIEGIQVILKKMYNVVNISYMGLSREMEFHADKIAAHVIGVEPLKNALLRTNLADQSFNSVLSFYNDKLVDNLRSENLYKEQSFVLNFIATQNNIPIINSLPKVTLEELNKFNKSKLVVKDQWASHPSTEERIEMLENTNINLNQALFVPANKIFKNIEKNQEEFTNWIFKDVKYTGNITSNLFANFKTAFEKEYFENTFSKIYNGYYDNKNPVPFDIDKENSEDQDISFEDLFSDKKVDLVYTSIALQNDIGLLKQIADKNIPVKTFDYDGKKFKCKDSSELLSKLNTELEQVNDSIKQNDIKIFHFHRKCEKAQNKVPLLEITYKHFFEFDRQFDAKYEIHSKLTKELQFVSVTTPFEQIKTNLESIEPLETELKERIKELLTDHSQIGEITTEIKDNLELYISKKQDYFEYNRYNNDNLEILFTAIRNYAYLLSKGYFLMKKKLLEYQEKLMKKGQLRE